MDLRTKSDSLPRRIPGWLLLAGMLLLTSSCALEGTSVPQPPSLPQGQTACVPDFEFRQGWLGGDSVYSVPIPGGEADLQTFWLFGDSFIGEPGAPDRNAAQMIHNSVARSRCSESGFEIDFVWRRTSEGLPTAVFDSPIRGRFVWPFDGFYLKSRLHVVLLEVEPTEPTGPLGLPFRITRSLIARIENPADSVLDWRIDVRTLISDARGLPNAAVFVGTDHVFFMSVDNADPARQPRFLARLPRATLERWPESLESDFETFARDGDWLAGFDPARAQLLIPDNATEMSLDWIARDGSFLAVYGAPIQTADDGTPFRTSSRTADKIEANEEAATIFARTAPTLTGPWSARVALHRISERRAGPDGAPPSGEICYAAKAHVEHSPPNELVLTYVCNTHARPGGGEDHADGTGNALEPLIRIRNRMDLYQPRVVRQPWPVETDRGAISPTASRPERALPPRFP